ncbi:MAG TPA: hypothetical protein VEW42_05010 [Candidatus Eisenbacteria bacterium]|nr:hypothetical protein [Candidatus Eisenbacteria bacterium]
MPHYPSKTSEVFAKARHMLAIARSQERVLGHTVGKPDVQALEVAGRRLINSMRSGKAAGLSPENEADALHAGVDLHEETRHRRRKT